MAGIDLPAGCQQLDGRNALGYVRTRDTPRADLDRMVNQRQFMSALLHRGASPAVWLNPWRWYSVPHAAADALTVDHGDHVWDLARLGWALHGSTTTLTVPIGEFTSNGAGSVVVWNHDEAAQAVRRAGLRPAGARRRARRTALAIDYVADAQRIFNVAFLYLGKAGLSNLYHAHLKLRKTFPE